VDSGTKEGLVCVDVADTRYPPLIHDRLLDGLGGAVESCGEASEIEILGQGFGTNSRSIGLPLCLIQ
jgi:hypothetical protein